MRKILRSFFTALLIFMFFVSLVFVSGYSFYLGFVGGRYYERAYEARGSVRLFHCRNNEIQQDLDLIQEGG